MKPYGISIFCDDIRFEQGNKFSLVGCYGPDLIINQEPPAILPKLAVLISVRLPNAPTPKAKLLVYSPNSRDPIYSHDFVENNTVLEEKAPKEPDSSTVKGFVIPLVFSPMQINKGGQFRVRLEIGDETIRLGSLVVSFKPPDAVENLS